jgi:hypothetical protein
MKAFTTEKDRRYVEIHGAQSAGSNPFNKKSVPRALRLPCVLCD